MKKKKCEKKLIEVPQRDLILNGANSVVKSEFYAFSFTLAAASKLF